MLSSGELVKKKKKVQRLLKVMEATWEINNIKERSRWLGRKQIPDVAGSAGDGVGELR